MEISIEEYNFLINRVKSLEDSISKILSLAKDKSSVVSLVRSEKPIDKVISVSDIVDCGIDLMADRNGNITLK